MEVGFRSGLSDDSSFEFFPPSPRLWVPAYRALPGEGTSLARVERREGRYGGSLHGHR